MVNDTTENAMLLDEVLSGLRAPQPTLPCKLFYDHRGSELYEQITKLEQYYPFASEVGILSSHACDIATAIGRESIVFEYGSGAGVKTRLLLDALDDCVAYLPIDIASSHLQRLAGELAQEYPKLKVSPIAADFTQPIVIPSALSRHTNRVAFFPGSTVGNFDEPQAIELLGQMRHTVGNAGWLLIGVDIPKDRAQLELAYDDPQGVTAQFNLNILSHVNRLFDANFNAKSFQHKAHWNAFAQCIEMHLQASNDQSVTVAGETFEFAQGETILTELSHKYDVLRFRSMGCRAGFSSRAVWLDAGGRYSLHLMVAR